MRSVLKYIVMMICALSFISCSMGEFDALRPDENNTIEFIARPTGFVTTNVTTKAAKEGWETYVYNAYLLLFDEGGIIIDEPKELTVSNNAILPYRFTLDEGSFAKAYILANVPAGSVDFSNTSELESKVLDLTYETSSDNYIAAPTLNGNPCLPMLGVATLSDKKANKVTIELKSLFAKINLTIKMNLINSTGLINRASFNLKKIELIDLPKKVLIGEDDSDSQWVTIEGYSYMREPNITIYEGENTADEFLGTVREYTTSCYVPEYNLSPIDSPSDKEQNKPSNFDSSKHPVHIVVTGDLTHDNLNSGNGVPFTYSLYLGENQVDDFDIKRNKSYNYLMTITGINEARLEQDERIDATFSTTNLAAKESANCYIISEIGRYEFPLFKGNTEEAIGTVGFNSDGTVKYELITDNTANTITNVKLDGNNIVFDVNMDTFKAVENGNTMLLVKNSSDSVLWSWHLWFCQDGDRPDDESTLERYVGDNGQFNGYYVMNRSLGAKANEGIDFTSFGGDNYALWKDGCYYQWGDKDPYFNGGYQGGVERGSWDGTSKTKTDPCPPGYKVPSENIWRTKNPDASYVIDVANVTYSLSNSERYAYNLTRETGGNLPSNFIIYPYSGYYISNSKDEKTSSTISDITPDSYINGYLDGIEVGELYPVALLHLRFVKVSYSFVAESTVGALWASDSKVPLEYGFAGIKDGGVFSDVEITGLSYYEAKITTEKIKTGSIFGVPIYSDCIKTVTWPNEPTKLTADEIENKINSGGILSHWKAAIQALREDIQDTYIEGKNQFIYIHPSEGNEYATEYGLQVRCVKE